MGSFFKFPAFTTLRILLSRFYCFYKTEFKTKKLLNYFRSFSYLSGHTSVAGACGCAVYPCLPRAINLSGSALRSQASRLLSSGRPSSLTRASMPAFPPPGRRSFGFESCCPGFIVFIKLNLKQKSS